MARDASATRREPAVVGAPAARTSRLASSTTWFVRWRAAASGGSWRFWRASPAMAASTWATIEAIRATSSHSSVARTAVPATVDRPAGIGDVAAPQARTRPWRCSTGRPAAARARRRTRGSSGRAAARPSRRHPSRSRRSPAAGRWRGRRRRPAASSSRVRRRRAPRASGRAGRACRRRCPPGSCRRRPRVRRAGRPRSPRTRRRPPPRGG